MMEFLGMQRVGVDVGRDTLIHVRKRVAEGPERRFCIGTSFKFYFIIEKHCCR